MLSSPVPPSGGIPAGELPAGGSRTGCSPAGEPQPGAGPLPRKPLGRTGLSVTAIGFGSAPIGDLYGRLDESAAIETAATALRAGINLLDTSPLYGHGLAELRCGTALRLIGRDGVILSSKVGRTMDPRGPRGDGSGYVGGLPHGARFDYSHDGALRSVEQSLLRLGTDRLDLVLIHDVNVGTHGREGAEIRFAEAMDGAYRALDRLRREGVVTGIGVGLNEHEMCARFARAGDFDAMLLAGRYSLLEQPALPEFLPLAAAKGIGVLLGGVYNSGILATGPVPGARYNYRPAPPAILDRVRRIEEVCRAHAVALADAALLFAAAHPAVASVVLGAVSPDEVRQNLLAFGRRVPAALWSDLKTEGLLDPAAPVPAVPVPAVPVPAAPARA